MGTTTKGTIPSIAREGDFVVVDERRNSGITTIKNCAVKK
jgi:hypothetical protein